VTSVIVSTSAGPNRHIDDQDRVFLATLEKDSYLSNVPRDTMISAAHI
jgi:hypothetical protein